MSTDPCPHGFADPAWCADCRSLGEPPAHQEAQGYPDAFPARYSSSCECGDRIQPGDLIVSVLREGGYEYVHEECR